MPDDLPSNKVQLNLSGNHLTFIKEDAFANLTLLKDVDLSWDDLKSIPKNTFRNLTLLETINVNNNFIQGGFYLPRNSATVLVRFNRLSLIHLKLVLKHSKRIKNLDITGNPIGPNLTVDTFEGCENMIFLYLRECGLKHIESGNFKSMEQLTYLDLTFNMLSRMEPGTFKGLSDNLHHLDLRFNSLSTILDGTFSRFKSLHSLLLKTNKLTSVPDLTGLTSLVKLEMQYNKIKDISRLNSPTLKHVKDL